MAYVAISGELLNSVQADIQAMARKELASIGEVPPLNGTEEYVERALWGKYAHLRTQLPAEWKRECPHVALTIQFPEGRWQANMKLAKPAEAPPNFDYWNPPKIMMSSSDPSIADIVERIGNRHDAEKRWQDVENQVMGFLRKCRSLNEGLKLWPDLRMYIPKQYLDRIDRKVERNNSDASAAVDTLKNINTQQVVAAAVIARMSTGSGEGT